MTYLRQIPIDLPNGSPIDFWVFWGYFRGFEREMRVIGRIGGKGRRSWKKGILVRENVTPIGGKVEYSVMMKRL